MLPFPTPYSSPSKMSALAFRAQTVRPAQLTAAPLRRCAVRGAALRTRAAADLVDTAVAAGSFKTLVAAVQAAGLVETLKCGTYTIFAPVRALRAPLISSSAHPRAARCCTQTDDAFAKLPAGTVETLLKPENKQQLVDILTCVAARGARAAVCVAQGRGSPYPRQTGAARRI